MSGTQSAAIADLAEKLAGKAMEFAADPTGQDIRRLLEREFYLAIDDAISSTEQETREKVVREIVAFLRELAAREFAAALAHKQNDVATQHKIDGIAAQKLADLIERDFLKPEGDG